MIRWRLGETRGRTGREVLGTCWTLGNVERGGAGGEGEGLGRRRLGGEKEFNVADPPGSAGLDELGMKQAVGRLQGAKIENTD